MSTEESQTIDNVFTASANGDLEKLSKFVEQDGVSLSSTDNDGFYALHYAAHNNHSRIVQYIVEHGGDVNAVNDERVISLHLAAVIGSIFVADVLLQNGAKVEAADLKGRTAVHFAAQSGQTSFLNHIVAKYDADFDEPDNDGVRPLHSAAWNNHPEVVQYIIKHGGDVNAVDNDQWTALHFAATKGLISIADALLQNEAQVEAADLKGKRAVHIAAKYGQTSFLNHIVAKYDADFEVPDNAGERPLHIAAWNNHPEIVQYIIKHKGDVNAVDNDRWTALHFAAKKGSISVADALLQNEAQVDAADLKGKRAVHIAAEYGQTSFLNHIVAKYEADFEVQDNAGERPLHSAAWNNHPEIVQYIIKHGGDVNVGNNDQRTALHCAAVNGFISVADALLQNKAQVEAADLNGKRAVHFAADYGQTFFFNHIVAKYDADFDVPDKDGKRPLHSAAWNNHPEIVQYIIKHGGDVNAVDNNGWTALHFAAKQGSISVADALMQNEAQVEAVDLMGYRAVHIAAQFGHTSFLNHIVAKYHADFDVPDNDGVRPLHIAARNNHPEIVQYIIKKGRDVNDVDNDGWTALHYAATEGSISVADALLQNGAQVDAADLKGKRAVHIAAQFGHTSFLNHIVAKYHADFDLPDNDGVRPLHIAARNNHHEIVQYIIKKGRDVNDVDNDGWTALHYAATEGSISVADALLQNGAQVDAANLKGKRAVHIATEYGQISFLNHIVAKYHADFDVPDNGGERPMHRAADLGYVDIVKWLVSKGSSMKSQDMLGRTPLHYAALQENEDVIMVLMAASNKEDIMVKDDEGNTAIQLVGSRSRVKGSLRTSYFLQITMFAKALRAECKHLPNSNFKGNPEGPEGLPRGLPRGDGYKNWPMIIAIQGNAYTGKTLMSSVIALALNCPVISLDTILDASEPTNEKDTLISNAFNIIAQIVKHNIQLGFSVVIDSPLSRLSHLQKLIDLVSTDNPYNTRLVIIECKPENEYAYQLRFEEMDPTEYTSRWYKPKPVWPLPKVPRDYTDDDIPYGVSKLVIDNHENFSSARVVKAIFDVTSCGYGHKSNYNDDWDFIHEDMEELFTYYFPNCAKEFLTDDVLLLLERFHYFIFYQGSRDHCDRLCGVCDNQVYDSHYCCEDCPLVLHKSCAELARGEKKHFVPETFPLFVSSERPLRYTFPVESPCAECRRDGNGFSCKCVRCLFESHLKSRLLPTVVQHKGVKTFLTFNLSADHPKSGYICQACRKRVGYTSYFSDSSDFYHPECALLPPLLPHSHGGYKHDLEMITHRVEKEEDYLCDCCSKKMDPAIWYYYCGECNISMHMECAFLDFDA